MNILNFFVEVKNELAKVVWPTRKQTIQYTAVVIVFSLAISLILGAADLGLFTIFEKIVAR
jgi:preprotein translocase subunit SecE